MGRFVFLYLLLFLLLASCQKNDIKIITPEDVRTELRLENLIVSAGGIKYTPTDTVGDKIVFCVPQEVDISKMLFFFDNKKDSISANGAELKSGFSKLDFSNAQDGLVIKLRGESLPEKNYTITVLNTNLPVAFINTPSSQPILDKENWITDSSLMIWEKDNGVIYSDTTSVKGRGNITWTNYPKKPYALKLNEKAGLLGLTKHKRFCLLALYHGYLGNYYMAEVSKRTLNLPWVPEGKYVELVLNGKFQGLYYLSEQIKVDKNRVNISKMKTTDLEGANLTGGYLLEFDNVFDEPYKFRSNLYDMPVMLRSPDEDVPQEQFDYIKNYVNNMEAELAKIGEEESGYQEYLDVNSFADYWMASEVIYNYEIYKPRSFYMYKGRDGVDSEPGTVCKMKAGPFWDQEEIWTAHWWNNKDAHYFGALFKDKEYRKAVKNNWPLFRDNLEGRGQYPHILESINTLYSAISYSARRDSTMWQNTSTSLFNDVKTLNEGLTSKLDWVEDYISTLE